MNLTELVSFMKQHHIVHAKTEGMELTLHPDAFTEVSGEMPKNEPPDTRVGKTGQTRDQQLELFGRVFEEDFDEPIARQE